MVIPASSLDAKSQKVGSIDVMNKKGRTTPEPENWRFKNINGTFELIYLLNMKDIYINVTFSFVYMDLLKLE